MKRLTGTFYCLRFFFLLHWSLDQKFKTFKIQCNFVECVHSFAFAYCKKKREREYSFPKNLFLIGSIHFHDFLSVEEELLQKKKNCPSYFVHIQMMVICAYYFNDFHFSGPKICYSYHFTWIQFEHTASLTIWTTDCSYVLCLEIVSKVK